MLKVVRASFDRMLGSVQIGTLMMGLDAGKKADQTAVIGSEKLLEDQHRRELVLGEVLLGKL